MKNKKLISIVKNQRLWIFPILILAILGEGAFGQEERIVVEYKFELPKTDTLRIPIAKEGPFRTFDRIQILDLHNYGEPGEPVLPYKTARILLPPSHEVDSIEVIPGEEVPLDGEYYIEPGQIPTPPSLGIFHYTPPDPRIYESKQPFPDSVYRVISTQNFRGHKILLVNLFPIRYIPLDRRVSYFESMKVIVKTKKVKEKEPLYRGVFRDREKVKFLIDNPEMLKEYKMIEKSSRKSNPLPPGDYDMVIITDSTLIPVFNAYTTWRTNNRGIRTIVYNVATILNTYSGYDDAEKVRNFIINAYNDWGIDYVLLGGDVEIVPHRSLFHRIQLYNPSTGIYWHTDNIPADIYYAGLDGDWDSDGDHVYGEMNPSPPATDEADLLAEVYVGRAPVNTVTEAQNFCNKIRSYEESNLDTYRCDWLFFSTILDAGVPTYGGDYKDDTENSELSSPHNFNITKIYQHSGGTSAQVINALNAGQRIGNSCGHGNYVSFGMLNRTNVDNLTNTEYCLIYTWACLTNKFEVTDAISEHFLYTQHGAFAYIGNSRYGLFSNTGDASGPSHGFELEFYDALINEEIARVGKALQDSREEFSGSTSMYDRWIYYVLNLMGDPSTLLRIKNDLWIKTAANDNGSTPVSSTSWDSPDIAIDSPDGGWQTPTPFIAHENPNFGRINHVYIRVRNPGCEDAKNVMVKLYWADRTGGIPWPSAWNYVGSKTISSIPAGGEVITPYIPWTPTGTAIRHPCMLATAECDADPISMHAPRYDNNVAQKNIFIIPPEPSGPGFSLSIHSGIAIPTGSFANDFGRSWNILLDGEYHFTPQLSLVGLVGYNDFKSKTTGVGDIYWFNFSINMRYYQPLSGPWSVYIGAGPGIYKPKVGDSEFGANAGFGVDYEPISRIVFELGVDYHVIFDADIQFVHIHAGVVRRF